MAGSGDRPTQYPVFRSGAFLTITVALDAYYSLPGHLDNHRTLHRPRSCSAIIDIITIDVVKIGGRRSKALH
jgi:hypothetical protein